MRHISASKIDPSNKCIKAVFCVRNEKFRLPFFLDYYRKLGVKEFFAIDNESTDDTQAYLLNQNDVHVFHTTQAYKSSNAGRDWTTEIANKYCEGDWCLTLDVDEFFVFPYMEHVDLTTMVSYLDTFGYQGVFSIFLDFYSNRLLSETHYAENASPFDVCEYFDSPESYSCYEREIFPHIEIKGGPRQRVFWAGEEDPKVGPSMRKLVLIKWQKGFTYTHSTHSCTPLKLADVTGAIAHFKFLSHFAQYAKEEVKRNARIANSIDWKVYAKVLDTSDVCFYSDGTSLKYENSKSLLKANVISASINYADYCLHGLNDTAKRSKTSASGKSSEYKQGAIKSSSREFSEDALVGYNQVVKLWSAISSFSGTSTPEGGDIQSLTRFERDVSIAANSGLWRLSYPLRKFASKLGLTDQRSLTEENFYNQNLHARFTFIYKSIWWDLLGPLRVIEKVIRRIRRKSN